MIGRDSNTGGSDMWSKALPVRPQRYAGEVRLHMETSHKYVMPQIRRKFLS